MGSKRWRRVATREAGMVRARVDFEGLSRRYATETRLSSAVPGDKSPGYVREPLRGSDGPGRRYATRFSFACRNTRAEARAYVRTPLTRQWNFSGRPGNGCEEWCRWRVRGEFRCSDKLDALTTRADQSVSSSEMQGLRRCETCRTISESPRPGIIQGGAGVTRTP
jgi:hypothetical protein